MAPDPKLVMMYTHWCAASAIRSVVTAPTAGEAEIESEIGERLTEAARSLSAFLRLLVFYALLYVVVEAYRDVDQRDQDLDALLDDPHREKLRRLRNAVFHVQEQPFNPKLWDFLLLPESEKWIKALNRQLEDYFKRHLPIEATLAALKR